MNKRVMLKLMAENDQKSPDILTAVVLARNRNEAYTTAVIFEEEAKEELPLQLDSWQKTLQKFPVELYFVFKQKKALRRFQIRLRHAFPDISITT